jgi:hypothetical protein
MDFAKNLLNKGISLDLKSVVKEEKESKDQPRRVIHSKEVFITNSLDKEFVNQLGFIKDRRPSKWSISFKNEQLVDANYIQQEIGTEFVNNEIKYKITKKVPSQIELIVGGKKGDKNGDKKNIVVPLADTVVLIGLRKNEEVIWSKDAEKYLKKVGVNVSVMNPIVYLGKINENKIEIFKTNLTEGEILNAILRLSKLLNKNIQVLLKDKILIELLKCMIGGSSHIKQIVKSEKLVSVSDRVLFEEKISKIHYFKLI